MQDHNDKLRGSGSAIQVEQLTKRYGPPNPVQAVNEVSFSIDSGELFGLIGPDGAGKTTLFRMLATLLLPDAGSGRIHGMDLVKAYKSLRRILGYMPGKFSLYSDLTVEENLRFFAALFHTTIRQNFDLIRDIYVQIERFKDRRAGKLSGGMKQKLALCCALIHRPAVLLLDEPTTGVDPVSRKEFWEILQKLKSEGITMVVSTPYMDEAVRCDRIGLLRNGSLFRVDTPAAIIASYPDELFALKADQMHRLLHVLAQEKEAVSAYAFGEYAHLRFPQGATTAAALVHHFSTLGFSGIEVHRIAATIEDYFMAHSIPSHGSASH